MSFIDVFYSTCFSVPATVWPPFSLKDVENIRIIVIVIIWRCKVIILFFSPPDKQQPEPQRQGVHPGYPETRHVTPPGSAPPVHTVTSSTRCLPYFPAATRPSAWRVAKVLRSHVFKFRVPVTAVLHLSVCPPVCLSTCPSVHLSVCLSTCPSVCGDSLNVNQLRVFVFTLRTNCFCYRRLWSHSELLFALL